MDAPEHLWVQTRLQLVQRSIVGRPRHLPCNYVNRLIGQRRIDDLLACTSKNRSPTLTAT